MRKKKMKTLIVIGIVLGIGIIFLASLNSLSEIRKEECKAWGGVMTGPFGCVTSNADFGDPTLSKYGVEYNELVTREVRAISQVAKEIISERNCHKFSEDEAENLPDGLKSDIESSAEDLERFRDDGNEFLDRHAASISSEDAFSLLEKYDFQPTTKRVEGNTLPKLQDTVYVFECIFEDENYQYRIELEFESHYDGYGRLVFVNFTNNEQGVPVVENDNITLFTGGFNQTVVFQNELDHEITLEIKNPPPSEDLSYVIPESIVIPAGKGWSHFFRIDRQSDEPIYQYIVNPDALSGIIVVKGYPRCMTENEVTSLYAQVEAYPKFPSYVPDGYSFECGVHNMNAYVHLGYWTDDLREKFEDKPNDSNNREFFASGGLTVDYYNEYILNNWIANPDYDKYEKQTEKAEHPWATTLTIAGEPAVFRQQHFSKSGEQNSYNELLIFLDGEIQYKVRSSLPESELIKIGESLFTEPKPEDAFEKIFMEKPLSYWKHLDFDQLREYNSKSDGDDFYYELGRIIAREFFQNELVKQDIVNANEELIVHTGWALLPDPPIIGYNTVINATDGSTYVMHTSVQGNKLGDYFEMEGLIFEQHILTAIADDKPAKFVNKFSESPTINIVTEDGEDKLDSHDTIIDFSQTNSVTFVNNSPYPVRIQEVGENKIEDIPKETWHTKAIAPGEELTLQFNSTGHYEFNVKKITDSIPGYFEHHASGEIVAFTENMTDYTFEEGLLMGRVFIQDAPRAEIPWAGIGAGNNRGLEIAIVDSVKDAIPNAEEYYLAKAKSLIPFEITVIIE